MARPRPAKDYVIEALEKLHREGAEMLRSGLNMSSLESWRHWADLEVATLFGRDHPFSTKIHLAVRRISIVDPIEAHLDRNSVLAVRVNDSLRTLREIIEEVDRNELPDYRRGIPGALARFIALKNDHPLAFWVSFIGALASIAGLILTLFLLR